MIEITLLRNALPMHEQEMWASLAPTVPASLNKEWTFLGYDVADKGFISGLYDLSTTERGYTAEF